MIELIENRRKIKAKFLPITNKKTKSKLEKS